MAEPRIYQADFLTQLFQDPLDPAYAQAAEDRARLGPLPWWNRAGRKTITWIVLMAIGVLLSVAYQQVVRGAPERERIRAGLIGRINEFKETNAALASQAEQLQSDVATLRDQALGDPARIEQLRQLEAATGIRRVTGDGVLVRLSDGPDPVNIETQRVIDYDLQVLVNALWSHGAEAISINNTRLTALTAIRKGGETIYIGNVMVVGPYEIKAIGPPSLYDDFSGSEIARVYRAWQERPEHRFGFRVTEEDDLVLPGALMPDLEYAKVPVPAGSPSPTPTGGGK